jgi:hypothetical protein
MPSRLNRLGFLVSNLERLIPYLLITLAFAFIYMFVPNTRVRLRSALIGALVAGVLWQSIGYMFANFMAGSTQYAAIYSGLAIVILFMIWVYIAWLIVLVGASIAFYDQYPEYLGATTREQPAATLLSALPPTGCAKGCHWPLTAARACWSALPPIIHYGAGRPLPLFDRRRAVTSHSPCR